MTGLALRGWRNRRTAAVDNASNESQDRTDRAKEEDARHRGLEIAVMLIGRKLLDEKVARHRDDDIAAAA